ncbi:MAG: hydrogenase [Eubacteriales bacterium]|nr:hydrogenase [Eubacteriales bacterium]
MEFFFDLLSVLVLLSSFVLVSNKKITAYIKTFQIQSALIALIAGIMGWSIAVNEDKYDILIICVIIIALKVIFIPHLLYKTYGNIEYRVEKDFFMNIPIIVLICCGLVVFSYFSVSNIGSLTGFHINHQVVNSLSVVLIGFFFMISRKKAIGQIIGYLVIENGIFVTAMFSTNGMPFIVDIGIFIDMITAVMIMGIMVTRINKKFESINIDKLSKLKG